jgi:hypothetical protein
MFLAIFWGNVGNSWKFAMAVGKEGGCCDRDRIEGAGALTWIYPDNI